MSAGFGFSVGDFIATLKLVSTVIDALRDSGDSATECRQLLQHLLDLETALIEVKRLDVGDEHVDQVIALRQTAARCQDTIDRFWTKLQHYQPHLNSTGSSSRLKKSWAKIRWATCCKDDICRFKADIVGHTQSINLILAILQSRSLTIGNQLQAENHQNLSALVKDCLVVQRDVKDQLSQSSETSAQQLNEVFTIIRQTAQQDLQTFQNVMEIQKILRDLSPQLVLGQPVIFTDAFGRTAPFHLEFVRSKEAFMAVVQANSKGCDATSLRIQRGDFAIEDQKSNIDVNLSVSWDFCFKPGQHVDMSMILDGNGLEGSTCLRCKSRCVAEIGKDHKCVVCGLTSRRITEVGRVDDTVPTQSSGPSVPEIQQPVSRKRKRQVTLEEEISRYCKVRLRQKLDEHPSSLLTAMFRDRLMSFKEVKDGRIDVDWLCAEFKASVGSSRLFWVPARLHPELAPKEFKSSQTIQIHGYEDLPTPSRCTRTAPIDCVCGRKFSERANLERHQMAHICTPGKSLRSSKKVSRVVSHIKAEQPC